jgi:voltage-gated potassium channel
MRALSPLLASLLQEKALRQNLRAFAKFLAVIAATVLGFSVAFRALMHYAEHREFSWITSLYWTLTVMSTLGFGDITFHTEGGRLFSIFVLMTGLVMFVIVLPFAFIRYFYRRGSRRRSDAGSHARRRRTRSDTSSCASGTRSRAASSSA